MQPESSAVWHKQGCGPHPAKIFWVWATPTRMWMGSYPCAKLHWMPHQFFLHLRTLFPVCPAEAGTCFWSSTSWFPSGIGANSGLSIFQVVLLVNFFLDWTFLHSFPFFPKYICSYESRLWDQPGTRLGCHCPWPCNIQKLLSCSQVWGRWRWRKWWRWRTETCAAHFRVCKTI